jgi:flagellar biosynthetic protein FliQ
MMDNGFVMEITNQAVKVTMMLAAPMLLGALFVGIMVSLFQAVTQINEQTLAFIPKILVIVVAMVLLSPWMMETITSFTHDLYTSIPSVVMQR